MNLRTSKLHLLAYVLCGLSAALLTACKKNEVPEHLQNASAHRQQDEARAADYLSKARAEMTKGNYDNARTLIETMRDSCRLAFDNREKGILLLDSIDLLCARADTASADRETRVHFYEKKLEHDRMQKSHIKQ